MLDFRGVFFMAVMKLHEVFFFWGGVPVGFSRSLEGSGIKSGQIIATSHDRFPPNGGLVREIPLFQGNPGW